MNKNEKSSFNIRNHWSGWFIFSRVSNRKKDMKFMVSFVVLLLFNTARIEHLYLDEWVRDMKKDRQVNLHYGDMTDSSSLIRIIQQVQPDEIYNLAAQSHVKVSFDVPEYTAEADAVGTLACWKLSVSLEWKRKHAFIRLPLPNYSVWYRKFRRRKLLLSIPVPIWSSPKQYGFWITKNYRENYGMYAVNGILFLIMKVNVEARLS